MEQYILHIRFIASVSDYKMLTSRRSTDGRFMGSLFCGLSAVM